MLLNADDFVTHVNPALEVIRNRHIGQPDGVNWFDLSDQERQQIEAALAKCSDNDTDIAWERHFLTALWCVAEERAGCVPLRDLTQHRLKIEKVQTLPNQRSSSIETGRLLYTTAFLQFWLDEREKAVTAFIASEEIGRTLPDSFLLCRSLQGRASCALSSSQFDQAYAFVMDAHRWANKLGSNHERIRCCLLEGNIEEYRTTYSRAQSIYEDVLAQAEVSKDLRAQRRIYSGLGNVSQHLCRYDEAQEHYNRARSISHDLAAVETNYAMDATIASNESSLMFEVERLDKGLEKAAEAINLFERAGRREHQASALINLTAYETILHRLEDAFGHLVKATAIASELKSHRIIAFALAEFARLYEQFAYHEARVVLFGAIDALYRHIGAEVPKNQIQNYEHYKSDLIGMLGQKQYDTAWQRGLQMSSEQAVAFAIQMHPN